jgi:ketosteroid isomerase-like protein
MRRLLLSLSVVAVIGLSGAGVPSLRSAEKTDHSNEDDKAAILRIEQEWLQAMKNHDISWFERNFASDCTEINSGNGQLKTKEQGIADFKAEKTVFETVEFSDIKARVEGNAAVANGVTHVTGQDEQGQKFDVRIAFTDTYIRRGGRWQVWAAQHTRVRP